METTPNGIKYDYSICTSGAMFIVYPNKNTEFEIKEAIKYIRDNRDMVSLRLARFEDKVELFRHELFTHEKTRHLKWYQIFDVLKVQKKYVADGISIEHYIDTFVLPNICNMPVFDPLYKNF